MSYTALMLSLLINTSPVVESVHPMVDDYTVTEPVIIEVKGNINSFTANSFAEQMQKAQETGQPIIPIVISSYGGSVYSLLEMIDTIKKSKVPVATIVVGKAMSAGAVLLSCGKKGMRYAAPNSTIMIHEVSSMTGGKAGEIKATAAEVTRLNTLLFETISKNIGKPTDYIKKMVHSQGHADWYITPEEALKHGIIDKIGNPDLVVQIGVRVMLK